MNVRNIKLADAAEDEVMNRRRNVVYNFNMVFQTVENTCKIYDINIYS